MAACLLASCALAPLARARQGGQEPSALAASAPAEQRAFVEIESLSTRAFVHEPIRVRLCIGVDAEFFATSALQLFQRRLDVPAQVAAAWLAGLPGTMLMEEPASASQGLTIALADGIATAARVEPRTLAGRRFTVLELARTFVPLRPGALVVPGAQLSFAHATRFRDELLGGRVALDREDVVVFAEPLVLAIEPWPEEGRPARFSGAVGRFTLRAEASPRNPRAGESVALALHIEGYGELAVFEPPRLDELPGFLCLGTREERSASRRIVTYDLVPRDERVTAIPAIALEFLDPGPPARYATAQSDPLPIDVRPSASTAPAPPPDPDAPERAPSRVRRALWLAAGLAAALALCAWRAARARSRRSPAQVAAAAFRARVGARGDDLAAALAEFLAACLCCTPAAVIAPSLRARLVAAGVPDELAARSAALLEALVGARYGGRAPSDAAPAARALVDALAEQLHFAPRSPR